MALQHLGGLALACRQDRTSVALLALRLLQILDWCLQWYELEVHDVVVCVVSWMRTTEAWQFHAWPGSCT